MKLEHARQLVRLHGADAVACQILNPGIDHWFAAANDAVVGFVRRHKVRVVAGSAVCAADRLADVALEFERDAAAGERVCYFGAEAPLGGTLSQSAHAFPRPSGCPTSMAHRALSLQCCMPRLSQGPTQPCPQQGGHCFRVAGRAREESSGAAALPAPVAGNAQVVTAAFTGNSPVAAVVSALVRPARLLGRDVDLA